MFTSFRDYFGGWFWPLAIVTILVLTHAGKKCVVVVVGGYHLLVSRDKKFAMNYAQHGGIDRKRVVASTTKQLILIRHGTSTWNDVFNRGINWKFPFRVLNALAREAMLFVTSDSCLFDAPLGPSGIAQAQRIDEFIRKGYWSKASGDSSASENAPLPLSGDDESVNTGVPPTARLLAQAGPNCLVVSSPLRRCIETASLGLFSRLNGGKERILVLSSLQELTRNVDGLSLSGPGELPPVSWSFRSLEARYGVEWSSWFERHLDLAFKEGFKSSRRRGDDRMRQFMHWLFRSSHDTVVISGHSLWFRFFFQAYFPLEGHECTKQKIQNGGVVACRVTRYEMESGALRHEIDPDSLVPLLLGFESKDKKHS